MAGILTFFPMTKPARTPRFGPGTGSGRRPIPADEYLARWSQVVEALKAGMAVRAINKQYGAVPETVRHVRRFMEAGGWTPPPKPPRPMIVRPKPEPKPPRVGMTVEERLQKYPGVAFWLRAGKTMPEVAKLEGVSLNTVRIVKRAMVAQGEVL